MLRHHIHEDFVLKRNIVLLFSGTIEKLQRFWLAGACKKKKKKGLSSHTLGILNFTSAFILLGGGMVLGALLLILEHLYFRFGRKSLQKWDKKGCCSLISLVGIPSTLCDINKGYD